MYNGNQDKVGYFGFGSAFLRRVTQFWKLDTKRITYENNIATYDLQNLDLTTQNDDFIPLYGSTLGSILGLLVKTNLQWEGESGNVTAWLSPETEETVKYLPDNRQFIEWLSKEPINEVLAFIEYLRDLEHSISKFFDEDNIFDIGLLRYSISSVYYIMGFSILLLIISIILKIKFSKKLYNCYKVITKKELDYQIGEITKFLHTLYEYNESSGKLSSKLVIKLEKVDKAAILRSLIGSYTFQASKEMEGKKGKVFKDELAQFQDFMVDQKKFLRQVSNSTEINYQEEDKDIVNAYKNTEAVERWIYCMGLQRVLLTLVVFIGLIVLTYFTRRDALGTINTDYHYRTQSLKLFDPSIGDVSYANMLMSVYFYHGQNESVLGKEHIKFFPIKFINH